MTVGEGGEGECMTVGEGGEGKCMTVRKTFLCKLSLFHSLSGLQITVCDLVQQPLDFCVLYECYEQAASSLHLLSSPEYSYYK